MAMKASSEAFWLTVVNTIENTKPNKFIESAVAASDYSWFIAHQLHMSVLFGSEIGG